MTRVRVGERLDLAITRPTAVCLVNGGLQGLAGVGFWLARTAVYMGLCARTPEAYFDMVGKAHSES